MDEQAGQQPQYQKQYVIQKEKVSPVKSFFRILVTLLIIALIAGLCYGVWLLIKFAMDNGYLF